MEPRWNPGERGKAGYGSGLGGEWAEGVKASASA